MSGSVVGAIVAVSASVMVMLRVVMMVSITVHSACCRHIRGSVVAVIWLSWHHNYILIILYRWIKVIHQSFTVLIDGNPMRANARITSVTSPFMSSCVHIFRIPRPIIVLHVFVISVFTWSSHGSKLRYVHVRWRHRNTHDTSALPFGCI